MVRIDMKFNGKRITSSHQLEREMKRSFEKTVEQGIRKAAGPGVRIRKTSSGFEAEGSSGQIRRMTQRFR